MDMRRRAVLSALGGSAVSALALSGAAGASGDCAYGTIQPDEDPGTPELYYARDAAGRELIERVADRWERETGRSLSLTQSFGSYIAELQSELLEDDGPELFEFAHDRAGKFDDTGFFPNRVDDIDIPDCMFTDPALAASFYDGQRIGVPLAADTVALYYNTEMVDSPPATLDEMTAIMDAYYDPTQGTYGLAYPINPYFVTGFAQAYGGEILDETGRLGLTSDAVIRGLEVVMDDLAPYMADDPSGDAQRSLFLEGDAPLYIGGPWDLPALRESSVEFGVTTLPTVPDGGTPRPFMGVKLLYFGEPMDDSEHAGAARDFAEWFASNEALLLEHARETGEVPVHTNLVGSDRLSPGIGAFAEQAATGYPMPQSPLMDQVWGPFGDAVVRTFEGEGDLEANLQQAEQEVYRMWADEDEGNGLLTVAGRPPRDPDRDGVFEDIDGNGAVDGRDVLTYLERRNSEVFRRYPARFDVDGDGRAGTISDALALARELD